MRPVLFHLGNIPVRSFGIMVLAGFLLALWYAMSSARRRMRVRGAESKQGEDQILRFAQNDGRGFAQNYKPPITPDHVFDFSLMALFVCIAGARILYVLLDWNEFQGRWTEIFKVWTGGISIYGAIVSGSLFLWWYCRRHNLDYLEFADICAPAFALGYAIGRIGCLLNGCCYGSECSLPWAMQFPDERFNGARLTPPSHPTQLYATFMNLAFFAFLEWRSRKSHPRGAIFLSYLALYSIYRFIDEQFRKGATADIFLWGMTHAQVFTLIALPVILYFLARLYQPARLPKAAVSSG